MSLIGLQSAVAAIIRHPRAKYDWKGNFLDTFDLTSSERRIVEKLSLHEELNKYGHGQADARLEVMMNHVDRVPRFIPQRVLKNIWFDLFEPTAIYKKSDLAGHFEMSLAFLNFLLTDMNARKRLKRSCPIFIFDMIKFEIAELELSRYYLEDPALIEGSVVNNPHFRVMDFEFDIPGWLANPQEEDLESFVRPLTLAFVKGEKVFPKMFEITSEFKEFLLSQIGVGPRLEASEAMKSDLKKMGLIL